METITVQISERAHKILSAVVETYVQTAEPVGSRLVAKRPEIGCSPATVRNIMADLEELGLLYQPYTSAGRVPTEAGFRYYIRFILKFRRLSSEEAETIEETLSSQPIEDITALLKGASRLLSELSGHTAVVLSPRMGLENLRHVEFVRLKEGTVLVICVGETGQVQNRLVELNGDVSQEALDRFARYLNEKLERLSLLEARDEILREMEEEKRLFEGLYEGLVSLKAAEELIVEGSTRLLEHPEFKRMEKLRAVLKALEEKTVLIEILDKCFTAKGVQIFIGSESSLGDLKDIGLIVSPYLKSDHPVGSLGILGPMRMDYARVVPLVEYTAKVLSRLLDKLAL